MSSSWYIECNVIHFCTYDTWDAWIFTSSSIGGFPFLSRQVDHINNEKRLMAQISYPFIVNMMGYSKVATVRDRDEDFRKWNSTEIIWTCGLGHVIKSLVYMICICNMYKYFWYWYCENMMLSVVHSYLVRLCGNFPLWLGNLRVLGGRVLAWINFPTRTWNDASGLNPTVDGWNPANQLRLVV